MPGRSFFSDNYRYGFNGMEKDDEVAGSGNSYTAEFWQYDSRLGRRWNIDPVDQISISNYAAFRNNPIFFIDPFGNKAGDFYSQSGKYLGTDGENDGKVFVVTDRDEARNIKKTNRKDGVTSVDAVSSAVELPSKTIRSEMTKSVGMDKENPFREYGGVFGVDSDGNEKLIWANPGDEADPSKVGEATINVFDAANPSEQGSLTGIQGTFHTHPSGTVTESPKLDMSSSSTIGGTNTTYKFLQVPSGRDVKNSSNRAQQGLVTGNSYVIGTRSKTVEIYNGSGVQATFPLGKWGEVGK
jgi:RHS repeat-associated protein